MRDEGSLSDYTCRPCTSTSDMVEVALRRDYGGYLMEEDVGVAGNRTSLVPEHANGSAELLDLLTSRLAEPQAESKGNN